MTLPETVALEGVFDAVDMGLIVLDQDARVLEWNAWMAAAAAIPAEAARHRPLEAIFPGAA